MNEAGNPASRRSTLSRIMPVREAVDSEVRFGLRVSLFESTFANTFAILVSGAYLTGFALMLGATDLHLGILGALPMLATLPALVGAWAADRLKSRKKVVLYCAAVGRLIWLPMIFLPLLPLAPAVAIVVFIALYAASSLHSGVSTVVWQSWMSDLVPERLRGRFWGRRNQYVQAGAIAAMIFAGLGLDWFIDGGMEMAGYQTIFACAVVLGLVSLFALRRQPEPRMSLAPNRGFLANALVPFRDKRFAPALWGLTSFQFSVGLVGSFVSAYVLKNLKMSYTEISALNIFHLVIGILVSPLWGYAMDKSGMRSVALVNGVLVVFVPFMWIMSLSMGTWMVWLLWALSGVGWVGFGLVMLNLPFALSPKEGRGFYLAVCNISVGLGYFSGSLFGGFIAESITHWTARIGPFELVNYSVLFFLSGIGRLLSLYFFLRIEEVRKRPLLESVNYMGSLTWTRLQDLARQGVRIARRRPR